MEVKHKKSNLVILTETTLKKGTMKFRQRFSYDTCKHISCKVHHQHVRFKVFMAGFWHHVML